MGPHAAPNPDVASLHQMAAHTTEFRLDALLAGKVDALPFAPSPTHASARPAAEIAGAPWASKGATPPPRVPMGLKSTFAIGSSFEGIVAPAPVFAPGVVDKPASVPPPPSVPPPAPVAAPPIVRAEPAVAAKPVEVAPRPASTPPPRAPSPAPVAPPRVNVERSAPAPVVSAPEKPRRAPTPPPPRRENAAAEAVQGSLYGKFGPRR